MFKDKKPTPFCFAIISLLYFFYVVSQGNTKMIGDEIGGDPGGMILPLFLSIFMFFASLYIFFTDKKDDKKEKMSKEEKQLFILTISSAFLYLFLSKILGFIIISSAMIFILSFYNQRKAIKKEDLRLASIGFVFSISTSVLLYTIGRLITRNLFYLARANAIPSWMGNTNFAAMIMAIITVIYAVFMVILMKKKFSNTERKRTFMISFIIATVITELLYIIFRQVFLVDLVSGILKW